MFRLRLHPDSGSTGFLPKMLISLAIPLFRFSHSRTGDGGCIFLPGSSHHTHLGLLTSAGSVPFRLLPHAASQSVWPPRPQVGRPWDIAQSSQFAEEFIRRLAAQTRVTRGTAFDFFSAQLARFDFVSAP